MAKLNAAKRNKIPKKEFGLPEMLRLEQARWKMKASYRQHLRLRLTPRQIESSVRRSLSNTPYIV